MRSLERDHERIRLEQRFLDLNRQMGELSSIVKAVTEKLSNSKEGNVQDVLNSETLTRSDKHSISSGFTVISVLSFHFNLLGQLVHSACCKGLLEMIQFSFHRWLKVFQLKFRESE